MTKSPAIARGFFFGIGGRCRMGNIAHPAKAPHIGGRLKNIVSPE